MHTVPVQRTAELTALRVQTASQVSKQPPKNDTFPDDPVDAFMTADPHFGGLPTDIPDSTRGSVGAGGAFPDPTLSMDGHQASMSGGRLPEKQYGAGLMMTPVDDDPLFLGPIKPDYIFPLPSSVEDAVQLAWTASYRSASHPTVSACTATTPQPVPHSATVAVVAASGRGRLDESVRVAVAD